MSADGYLLTNAHVVANSLRVYAAFHDDTILEAKLVGADADADVAVLKVDAHGLTLQNSATRTSYCAETW